MLSQHWKEQRTINAIKIWCWLETAQRICRTSVRQVKISWLFCKQYISGTSCECSSSVHRLSKEIKQNTYSNKFMQILATDYLHNTEEPCYNKCIGPPRLDVKKKLPL